MIEHRAFPTLASVERDVKVRSDQLAVRGQLELLVRDQAFNAGVQIGRGHATLLQQLVASERAFAVDQDRQQLVAPFVTVRTGVARFLLADHAEHRGIPRTAAEHQPALSQIVQDATNGQWLVPVKVPQDFSARQNRLRRDEVEHRLPQRLPALGRAFAQTLQLADVRPQCHPEHVGAHLAADSLVVQFPRQVDENLVGNMRQRSSDATGRSQLRDEHRRLAHHRIDQKLGIHHYFLDSSTRRGAEYRTQAGTPRQALGVSIGSPASA